jgi:hypothetical protein
MSQSPGPRARFHAAHAKWNTTRDRFGRNLAESGPSSDQRNPLGATSSTAPSTPAVSHTAVRASNAATTGSLGV